MKDEDNEVLNINEDNINTKKKEKKRIVIDEDIPDNTKNVKKMKSNKKKDNRKLTKGEKIFLIVSILFIIGCFIFYGYRTYHYYHVTHDVVQDITLKEKLTSLNNIAYQNDGLYEKSGYLYYKGVNVNNYVYYSGRLFRIIDISDGIRMIEDNTNTNLVWSYDTSYNDSYVKSWLANYLNTLKDYDIYLKKNNWCNEAVTLDNYKCSDTIEDYVGLISTSDYLQAGGKNSYLNNETYFWTINKDSENNVFYINNEGNINNIYKKDDNYYSYGVRAVITLKDTIGFISGDGTKNNPFVIEELGKALLKDNSIGSYVTYKEDNYRILSIDNDGVSLIYDGVLEIEKKYNDVNKYLNNEFIKKYNKAELVKRDYYINEYSSNNKYEILNKTKKTDYVTIPSIGELFLNEFDNYWLNNYSNNSLGLYYTIDENKMLFSDLSSNSHHIRPIIKVNIDMVVSGGNGMKNSPLILSGLGDKYVEED